MKTLILLLLFVPLLNATSYGQLKADFSVSERSGCVPLLIKFQDLSTGNPTSWKWDLGNGTISTVQNPQAVYDKPGNYTIKLIVSNGTETDSIEFANYVTLYASPTIQFDASPLSGCSPLNVQFTDQSSAGSGTITERVWDFGDGSISNLEEPEHTYNIPGVFAVTLTLVNSYGCKKSFYKDSLIKVPPKADAQFDFTNSNPCGAPASVNFINKSSSANTSKFQWFFGDGQSSTSTNPSHTYTNPGDYTVQLFMESSDGCTDSTSKTISIASVKADFTLPDTFCLGSSVSFLNTSSPMPASVSWSFGDGGTDNQINGTHTYTKAGTYEVTMTALYGSCANKATKKITVLDNPVSSFSFTGTAQGCALPQTINFTNTSKNASGYKWLFGDGDSSIEQNPSHAYNLAGSYSVTLISYNANGCADSSVITNAVQLGEPKIDSIVGLPARGCAPAYVSPKVYISSAEHIKSYLWDFGDGSSSTDSTPTHIYPQEGTYTVNLTLTTESGCTVTQKIDNAVAVGHLAQVDFSATPTQGCASMGIQFNATASETPTSWSWIFGDGVKASGPNPLHKFIDTGYFTVILYVDNNGCVDSVTKEDYIYINPPVAKFSKKVDCLNSFSYQFADSSIGAQSWSWDFGDGNTSSSQNPSHIYAAAGQYVVTLNATNGDCISTKKDTIDVLNENPVLSVNLPEKLCKYDSVTFSVQNYNPQSFSSLIWVFGDGSKQSSLNASLSHHYSKVGTFTPSLIATFINGCSYTIPANSLVKVNGPNADFTSAEGTCINSSISFTDLSVSDGVHPITNWTFDYGDGTSVPYTAPPFSHSYTTAGTFPVKMVVHDSYGCKDSIIKDTAVKITQPLADFSVLDSIRCTTNKVSFVNNSKGLSFSSVWNFGDNTTSNNNQPTHPYAQEGQYTVSLTVTDKFGCKDSITKPNFLTIANPIASFTLSDTFGICPPLLTQTNNMSQNYTSLKWNFDDGNTSELPNPFHYYNMGGRYQLTLVVKGHGECYDTASRIVLLRGPSGTFEYEPQIGCEPTSIQFSSSAKNTVKYSWDFNNGIVTTTKDSSIKYTYTTPGIYKPKLIITDSSGCEVSVPNTDSIVVADVKAVLKATPQTGCDSSEVLFKDSSIVYNDTINSYQWDFGNGITSSSPNPTNHYTKPGTYNTTLIVTTKLGCTDTTHLPLMVNVNPSPKLIITSADSSCVASPVNFKGGFVADTVDRSSMQWAWNFGDGSIDSNRNTSYTYNNGGDYKVVLTATDKYNCTGTAEKIVAIIPPPTVNAGNDTAICLGSSIKLNPSGAFSYTWVNDGSLGCSRCANPRANPSVSTVYYVTG
ncbi:MAG: PKD domain-containing protein, partial [Ilyomonas sp.]